MPQPNEPGKGGGGLSNVTANDWFRFFELMNQIVNESNADNDQLAGLIVTNAQDNGDATYQTLRTFVSLPYGWTDTIPQEGTASDTVDLSENNWQRFWDLMDRITNNTGMNASNLAAEIVSKAAEDGIQASKDLQEFTQLPYNWNG